MNSDPWPGGTHTGPVPTAGGQKPEPCTGFGRYRQHPVRTAATTCRICAIPLCADCRIDHHHEGWP